jgi:hypothetical protein
MAPYEDSWAERLELSKRSSAPRGARNRSKTRAPLTLHDIRLLCPWPGCSQLPHVRVEYTAPEPGTLRLALGIRLGAQGGHVEVCDRHAAELGQALGPGRILALTSLG